MNTWNITTTGDDACRTAHVACEVMALVSRLRAVLEQTGRIEPIWELSEQIPSVGRSIVQVRVNLDFFETFFNSPVGYRAMFRRGPRIGSAANAALVTEIVSALSGRLPESVDAYSIEVGPEWIGRITLARSTFFRSLDPSLAKVWYSTAEIGLDGKIRLLPSGISDGKIDVGLPYHWVEIRQDQQDCIIEVKGAFIGSFGPFQVKDPELRARTLWKKGQA